MKVRIIPCLDIKGWADCKGSKVYRSGGCRDPVEVARAYDRAGADELFMLDIAASGETRKLPWIWLGG